MSQKYNKFSNNTVEINTNMQSANEVKRFSVKKEQLKKDSKEISADRIAMSFFATEALTSLGYTAYAVINTINKGFSGLTIAAVPALFFAYGGIKHMIQYYKEFIKKNKQVNNNEIINEDNEKRMMK